MNRVVFVVTMLFFASTKLLAQDSYIFMTVHNLGCRQSNDNYTGFIPNYGFAEGDLVQIILAGSNGHIDPPGADGLPGGDDVIPTNPGTSFAMNPASFTHSPNTFYSPRAILLQNAGIAPEPALHPGSKFYIRVWNGPSPNASTTYYNSATLSQDYPVGLESCSVDSSVRTIRFSPAFPALITYAVTLDNGHAFSTAPPSPQIAFWADSARSQIVWHPVPAVTSYRIESSLDDSIWTTFGSTADTVFSAPPDSGMYSLRLFRVYAIR